MVELLVVIGIIGILAGVLFVSFGGASDSARAAQCLTNMKNLAAACNAYAMKTGFYPLAGSREAMDMEDDNGTVKAVYTPQKGWISWLDEGQYLDNEGNQKASSHRSIKPCPFYGTGTEETDVYAITNGAIWKYTGFNRKIYTCPEHKLTSGKRVLWSYAMNSKFGYDYSQGSKPVATADSHGIWFNTMKRNDRVLLFAELPTIDPETGSRENEEPGETEADPTLQFKGNVSGKSYPEKSTWGCTAKWNGTAEVIGFPHRHGKRGRCGHVVFADGHTEKFVYNATGLDLEQLTTALCEGLDITFSPGKGYKVPNNADEME